MPFVAIDGAGDDVRVRAVLGAGDLVLYIAEGKSVSHRAAPMHGG